MLYREIIAVCSQIHTKHTNTLCGQNVEFMNVKLAVCKVKTGLQKTTFSTTAVRTSDLSSRIKYILREEARYVLLAWYFPY